MVVTCALHFQGGFFPEGVVFGEGEEIKSRQFV